MSNKVKVVTSKSIVDYLLSMDRDTSAFWVGKFLRDSLLGTDPLTARMNEHLHVIELDRLPLKLKDGAWYEDGQGKAVRIVQPENANAARWMGYREDGVCLGWFEPDGRYGGAATNSNRTLIKEIASPLYTITLMDGTEVPISRKFYEALEKRVSK